MSQHLQDRLAQLELNLATEKASDVPSQFYIEDLELSIAEIKNLIALTTQPYRMINGVKPE